MTYANQPLAEQHPMYAPSRFHQLGQAHIQHPSLDIVLNDMISCRSL
jgi:hypothetical protein